jgi:serine/threonine protein kinase/WD40 repeat protein
MDSDSSPSNVDFVDELAEQYLLRRRHGERPTPEEYAARYPEFASRILDLFPALEVIEVLKPTARDFEPPTGGQRGASLSDGAGAPARCLGGYTLLRELGRGGMGIVYEAEHGSLKNRVALKVMHPRFRPDKAYVRRFQREARAAAKLHHTNIVPVFDYGEHDGVCFYAMQCIVGVGLDQVLEDVRRLRAAASDKQTVVEPPTNPLTAISRGLVTGRFADAPTLAGTGDADLPAIERAIAQQQGDNLGSKLTSSGDSPPASSSIAGQPESVYFREVARLGTQVADALDYAHRQKVFHRDIKPSNVLLDTRGTAWVTDFGLAKVDEGGDLSKSHDMIGTLRFMPPERLRSTASGPDDDTNPLGDVYSLGATLYELLTLKPAFSEHDQARLIDQITHQTPVPPRQHDRRIPRDLETLVLKALAKDPHDRFSSAAELRDELHLYLESRPIKSRPIATVVRLWRWSARNPALAAASVASLLLAAALVVGSLITAWRLSAENVRFQITDRKMHENLFDSRKAQAEARRFSKRVGQRFESLEPLKQATSLGRELKLPPEYFDELREAAIASMALPDVKKTGRVIRRPPDVLLVAVDSSMTRYALRFSDGTISVRLMADDAEIAKFKAIGNRDIVTFLFSPDGRYLATHGSPDSSGHSVTVWDVDANKIALSDPGPVSSGAVLFSPDSRRMASGHVDGVVVVWDTMTGKSIHRWPGQSPALMPTFSPDSRHMAIGRMSPRGWTCDVVDAETGVIRRSIPQSAKMGMIAWSPDGAALAVSIDRRIYLWEVDTGVRKSVLEGPTNNGLTVAFDPTGTLLASNGWEHRLRLWDIAMSRQILSVTGDSFPIWWSLSQDGRFLLGDDSQLTTYQVEPALEYRSLVPTFDAPAGLWGLWRPSIHRDGRVAAVGSELGVLFIDVASARKLAFLPIGHTTSPVFEPSGDLLTLTNSSYGARRWPITLDQNRGEFRVGPPKKLPLAPKSFIAEDRSGRVIAIAYGSHVVVTTPDRTTRIEPLDDCRYVAITPDGQWLATGSHSGTGAQVWRISSGKKVADLKTEGIVEVSFSANGKWLMTSAPPCTLWSVGTWEEARRENGHGIAFSADGSQLLVQESSKLLRLIDTETGRLITRLESPDLCTLEALGAAFTPDGSKLVTVTRDGNAVHIWDLRAIRKQLAEMDLDWDAPPYPDVDPASPTLSPLPPLKVDLGPAPR